MELTDERYYLERIREALRSEDSTSDLGRAVARLRQPFVLGSNGKWHYEGFINLFASVRQALAAIDDSISSELPSFLLEPATIARIFGLHLEDFNWQGAGPGGDVEDKLDRILANTENLIAHRLSTPETSPSNPGHLLTKKEVARRFQISTRTLDRWRSMGLDLGELMVGGTIRFDPAKIANIIATQKVKRRRR